MKKMSLIKTIEKTSILTASFTFLINFILFILTVYYRSLRLEEACSYFGNLEIGAFLYYQALFSWGFYSIMLSAAILLIFFGLFFLKIKVFSRDKKFFLSLISAVTISLIFFLVAQSGIDLLYHNCLP